MANSIILYYTHGQKTKIFTEALCEVLRLPLLELKSPLNEKTPFKFIIHALYLAVTAKAYPVSNMPDLTDISEIYLCTPVWGGQVAAPAWYFLNHAELKNKTVHLLLTCGSADNIDKYRKKALDSLLLIDCVPGGALGFATGGEAPHRATVTEQLRTMLPFKGE